MPNGRPGDNPYDEIIHHGGSEYGEPVDGLVRQLSQLPGFSSVSREVASILWDHSPMGGSSKKPQLVAAAIEKLNALRTKLTTRKPD